MIPIWAWNKETQKWELFPLDLLEDFEDGLKGFDKNYWYSQAADPDITPLVLDIVHGKFRQHFARQNFSNTSYGHYRYVFLPGLPLLTRWKLKAVEKASFLVEAAPKALIVALLTVGLGVIAIIIAMGIIGTMQLIAGALK